MTTHEDHPPNGERSNYRTHERTPDRRWVMRDDLPEPEALGYYRLGLTADRVRQLRARGWGPADVQTLRDLLDPNPSRIDPARSWRPVPPRRPLEIAERTWIELQLPPHLTHTYVAAGITPTEVPQWELRRKRGEDLDTELQFLTALLKRSTT